MIRMLIGSGLMVAFLGALLVAKQAEEGRLRETIGGWETCAREVETGKLQGDASACPAPIARADVLARRTARCDAALLSADLFAVEAACSTEVKTLLAERQAESRRADSLDQALKTVRADQAAAITRAETRARTQAERTARGQAAVSAAPRDAAGLVVCDAGCLRDRFAALD